MLNYRAFVEKRVLYFIKIRRNCGADITFSLGKIVISILIRNHLGILLLVKLFTALETFELITVSFLASLKEYIVRSTFSLKKAQSDSSMAIKSLSEKTNNFFEFGFSSWLHQKYQLILYLFLSYRKGWQYPCSPSC